MVTDNKRWNPRSHKEAALKVGRLRRQDLDHDNVVAMARERIEGLAERVAALEAQLALLPASPKEVLAELHLLEEVCAFYANDEDRAAKGGEPYGSIPTEVGLKARSARQRYLKQGSEQQGATT